MQADALAPKTLILAAVAAWALCVWMLGLFGLGSAIDPVPDDPSLIQSLPTIPVAKVERLGPLSEYAEISERPLFDQDRQPHPFFVNPQGENEQAESFDFVLTGVLVTAGFQMAIIQPRGGGVPIRLRPGESPMPSPSWKLEAVNPRSVIFIGPEGERTLELRVFNGVNGKPPAGILPSQPVTAEQTPEKWTEPPTVSASGEIVELRMTEEDVQSQQQADAIRQRIDKRRDRTHGTQ